jgi:hypothetical protein
VSLNIQDDIITANHTSHTARRLPGDQPLWEVSWLPDQPMNHNHAVAAMVLADLTKAEEQTSHLDPGTIGMAAKLLPDYDTSNTTGLAAEPEPSKHGQLSDPEAGG